MNSRSREHTAATGRKPAAKKLVRAPIAKWAVASLVTVAMLATAVALPSLYFILGLATQRDRTLLAQVLRRSRLRGNRPS